MYYRLFNNHLLIFYLFILGGPHVKHMEVSRLGVKSELQLPAYATATVKQIWAMSVTYTTAHGNTRSLTHWVRLGIEPTSSWMLVRFVSAALWWELTIFLFYHGHTLPHHLTFWHYFLTPWRKSLFTDFTELSLAFDSVPKKTLWAKLCISPWMLMFTHKNDALPSQWGSALLGRVFTQIRNKLSPLLHHRGLVVIFHVASSILV